MSWWTDIFGEPSEWRLCGTVESPIVKSNPMVDKPKSGKLWYYLSEDQYGKRKFDVADTFRGDLDLEEVGKSDIVYRSEEYLTTVKPWMSGRTIPEIAAYDKVKHHDFKRTLEGSKK